MVFSTWNWEAEINGIEKHKMQQNRNGIGKTEL